MPVGPALTAVTTNDDSVPETLSFAQALGGSWLNRPWIWIIGFFPNTVCVAILEASLLDETWNLVATTALLQFAIAVAVLASSVRLARRRQLVVPVPLVFLFLALTAIAQALLGGVFAATVIGGTTDFGLRIAFWLAIQWLWSPLVINTLAQYEHRRYLLAERSIHIDSWNANAKQGIIALRSQHLRLLETIRVTVSPVISEIRQQLSGNRPPRKQAEFLSTAEQLMALSNSVKTILETPHIINTLAWGVPEHSRRIAPIVDAINYEIRRPYLSSAILAILLLPVLAPGMFRLGGMPAIAELALGVASSAFLFASGLQLIKLFSKENSRLRTAQIAVVHVIASIAAPLVVGTMTWDPLGEREWVLLVFLPAGFLFAAVTVSGAFGLGDANRVLVDDMDQIRGRFGTFQHFVREEEKRMSDEVESVLHGPIRGRLSACIMALRFHVDELAVADSARGESIMRAVSKHLEDTARDLDRMNVPTTLTDRAYADGMKHDD